jgi:hypothetical protein
MNARDRFRATLHFQPVDRPFRFESLGMWPETLDRWYQEGLSPTLKSPTEKDWGAIQKDEYLRVLVKEFGFDRLDYLRDYVISGYTDSPYAPPFERVILSTENGICTVRDSDGITKRELAVYGTSSMPQFIKYPVENREDYLGLLPRLDPDHPERFAPDWDQICRAYAQRDFPVGLTLCGAFGHPRNLFGIERLSLEYFDSPALLEEIMEYWTDFYCRLTSKVWAGVKFDFVLFWEDMAYRSGSLISPAMVKRFMFPYYRKVIDHIRNLGCDLIIVDSDGDVHQLIPIFLEAGANVMLPFEVQAGMDIRVVRKTYGRDLAIMGGIDKRCLSIGGTRLGDELIQKIPPLLAQGGYIPCIDHTAPPDISLLQFRDYLQKVRRISSQ